MDLQQIIALCCVLAAGVLLVRGAVIRRRRARAGICAFACGCSGGSPLAKHVRKLKLTPGQKLL